MSNYSDQSRLKKSSLRISICSFCNCKSYLGLANCQHNTGSDMSPTQKTHMWSCRPADHRTRPWCRLKNHDQTRRKKKALKKAVNFAFNACMKIPPLCRHTLWMPAISKWSTAGQINALQPYVFFFLHTHRATSNWCSLDHRENFRLVTSNISPIPASSETENKLVFCL